MGEDEQVSKSASSVRSVRSTKTPSINKSPPTEFSLKKANESNNKQVYIRRKKCDVIFTRISYKHLKSHADFYSQFSLHQTDETNNKLQSTSSSSPNSSPNDKNIN